jgi:sterol desaturase/sphingolipid hydroxylase (fatty acid hydroxylase superfamily)
VCSLSQHYLCFSCCWTVYATLNYLELPFFEQFKAFDDPWPWKSDYEKWRKLFLESMKLVTFNNCVIIPTLAFAHYWAGDKMAYDFSPEGIPTPLKLAIQFLFCALCDDLAFYFSHRTLHTPWLY